MTFEQAVLVVLSRLEAVMEHSSEVDEAIAVLSATTRSEDDDTFAGTCGVSPDGRHHVSPTLCAYCLEYA